MPEHAHGASAFPTEAVIVGLAVVLAVAGLVAGRRQEARGGWPRRRTVLWLTGLAAAVAGALGPTALTDDPDLPVHMVGHLLLGMVAPLLLVLSAPVTLALRSLDVVPARRLAAVLRTPPVRVLAHPVVAAALNVGGLWLLFTTDLWAASHDDPLVALVVSAHVLGAGCLLTASLVGVDPDRHRASFALRSVVAVAALAAHDVLAKHLFAHPPVGVPVAEGELGALVMYHGGDLVDLALLVVLWAQWHRRRGARLARAGGAARGGAGRRTGTETPGGMEAPGGVEAPGASH